MKNFFQPIRYSIVENMGSIFTQHNTEFYKLKKSEQRNQNHRERGKWVLLLLALTLSQTMTAQELTFNPTSLAADTTVGNFKNVNFEVINNTLAGLSISDITLTGPNADQFSLASFNFPVPVDPVFSTPLGVTFAPTSTGTKNAIINVISDSPESPHTISIIGTSGIAIEPELVLSIINQPSGATVFDLLSINVGETDTISVIIKNNGNTDLNISDLQLDPVQFQFITGFTLPIIIGIADSAVIDVLATATYPISIPSPGITSISSNLSITHDDPDLSNPLVRQLKFIENAPNPSTSISSLNFGNVALATDSTLFFTVLNNVNSVVDGDLIITGLSFASNPDLFSTTTSFPIRIAPGESTSIGLTFTPDLFEFVNDVITVEGNVPVTLNMTGRGAIKLFQVDADTLDFGIVNASVGQFPDRIAISATGGLPVTINNLVISGPDARSFENFVSFPRTITDNDSILLSFFPAVSGFGQKNATVTVYSDATNSPHVFQLTGYATFSPTLVKSTDFISITDLNRLTTLDTTFTIKNSGNQTLTISSISLFTTTENFTEFALTNLPATPVSLELNEELTVGVRFMPTGTNYISAQVMIQSNSSTGLIEAVDLEAGVVFPVGYISNEFSLPIDSLRFGDVSTSGSKIDSMLVVNDGAGDLIITNMVFSGTSGGDFTAPGATYPIIVAARGNLKIPIQFTPAAVLPRVATLTIESNSISPLTTGLAGKGIRPFLSFPNSNFAGSVKTGGTSEIVRVIKNFGDVPANIYSFDFSGTDAALFGVSGVVTPITLDAGDSLMITISFSPIVAGGFSADMEIVSDAVNGPIISTITGTGFASSSFFTETPTVLVEGVQVAKEAIVKIGIENRGTLDLVLSSAFLELGSSGAFSAGSNAFGLPLTIAPGEIDSVEVRFYPLVAGLHEAVLSIESNDSGASTTVPLNRARIFLNGQADGPIPSFSVSELVFDSTAIGGGQRTLPIEVTNIGTGSLRFDFFKPDATADFNVYYKGYDAPPTDADAIAFTIVNVPAGTTQTINVVFSPLQLGPVNTSILAVMRDAANNRIAELFDVSGIGKEPATVIMGDLTFMANDFETTGTIKKLIGDVRVGNLKLGEEVTFDLVNETMIGLGDVYMSNVPPNGAQPGGTVKITTGGFGYFIDGVNKTLSLNPDQAQGINFFEIIGLTLDINDIKIIDDGVQMGGGLSLPEYIFGPNAGFTLDNVVVSQKNGVDIQGQFSLAPLSVFDAFSLDEVVIEFDSFKDCFSGSGGISVDAGIELSISAGIVLKNGGLDSVSLEVETLPGIPLGATGFALAGGNGAIGGIQVPPLSIQLGVDIVPVPPGANKVVRFNNVGFAYTFGRSFSAEGKLVIFDLDVAEASVIGSSTGVTAEAYFSLLEIFKGQAGISVHVLNDSLKVSGHAGLQYTIPKMQADVPDLIRGAVNEFLPITLAEISTSFTESSITGAMVVPPIPIRVSATIKLVDDKTEVIFGAEFTLFNGSGGRSSGRMNINELPYPVSYENSGSVNEHTHLEGQSIIINSGINTNGRSANAQVEDNTEFPFSLNESLESVIIRVEGVNEAPVFSVVLPTGQEVNEENAFSMGYAYTVYEEGNQSHIILSQTLSGEYIIKIQGVGEYQIDIAGAAFGPVLSLKDVKRNETTDEVEINWEDEDLDSDARITLYYDTDQEGANGEIIAANLSEDNVIDQYLWDTKDVLNGIYYIYGVMDDGKNAPSISYAANPVSIERVSAIEVPVLDNPTIEGSNVKLTWTATAEGETYFIFYEEDNVVSVRSPSYSAGKKLEFTFPNLKTGREYQFGITAVDVNKVHSNLSNIVSLSFISETENNVPNINGDEILNVVKIGDTYQTSILVTDGDTEDVLSYSLTSFPEGMSITENIISWTPVASQVGQAQVTVKVEDSSLATDSLQFIITVIDEQSSKSFMSFNNLNFNGLDEIVQVNLTDPGLNTTPDITEVFDVKVFSTSDPVGTLITLTETSTNSSLFVGSFGFTEGVSQAGLAGVSVADSVFVSYQDAYPQEEVTRFVLFEKAATPNEYPTAISINNTIISKETSLGDLIGLLSTEDLDDDSHVYTLVEGVGSADNNLFKIDGQALVFNTSQENLESDTLSIRIRTSDPKNGFFEQNIIISTESILGIEEDDILSQVTLFPNPTSRKVFVNIDSEKGAVTLTVLTNSGRKLRSKTFDKRWNDSRVSINVADLPAGIYFIQIEQKGQVINKRLVKK